MKIIIEKDIEKLKQLAAGRLSETIAGFCGKPLLLLLAGGSALSILKYARLPANAQNLTIGMFDERFSLDPAVNNFSQLMQTEFYSRAKAAGAAFLDSSVLAGEELGGFGLRIEDGLREWFEENPEGRAAATFGIGEDGHTGGMMPFPEDPELFSELFEGDHWYQEYDARGKNEFALRASCTMAFIREKISARIVFAAGEGKRSALQRMLAEKGSLAETPARIHREDPEAELFTDVALKA